MIVPINWLKEYIDVDLSAQEIAEKFTSIGYMLDRPITEINGEAVLDLEVRQNRPDCLSLIGLARELGAVLKHSIKLPVIDEKLEPSKGYMKVIIEDSTLCQRFHALFYEDITVQKSPDWLKSHLEAAGIKSINNVVDITNYVSLEFGMPLHAYDADLVTDRAITVRHAKKGEKLTLFGGKEVVFDEDDIIHADAQGPIGFGAIMGGEAKSVHPETTSIILEAAVYNQASVRRSSRRHAIRTEASTRLEKFLHPELTEIALQRAHWLIQSVCGGSLVDTTDVYPEIEQNAKIIFDTAQVRRLGGVDVSLSEIENILNHLEITCTKTIHNELECTIPYFRTDLEQEADLVEEIIRIHGYNTIPEQLPSTSAPKDIQSKPFELEETARDIMTALGYDEVITEPLTFETSPEKDPVTLENSLTSEKTMLRTTMQLSMEHALQERRKYRQTDIRLFEVGKIYFKENQLYKEQRTLGLITFGEHSYLNIKGDIEMLMSQMGLKGEIEMRPLASHSYFAQINLDDLFAHPSGNSMTVLTNPPHVIYHDFAIKVHQAYDVQQLMLELKKLDEMIFSVEYLETSRTTKDSKEVLIKVGYSQTGKMISEDDVKPTREKILSFIQSIS